MDIITYALCKKAGAEALSKAELALEKIAAMPRGFVFQGSCTYEELLEKTATAEVGDVWRVTDKSNTNYLFDLDDQWIPVVDQLITSINGKIGDVVLKTSDLENDSEFVNENQLAEVKELVEEEVTRATTAESGLTTAIGEESVRAQTAEANLTIAINNEIARAEAVEAGKQDALTAGENITIDENNVISVTGLKKNAYNSISQIDDYLFETQYSTENIDYDYANEYFKKSNEEFYGGGCTAISKDSKVLRHFDWFYDDKPEYVLRRPADIENNIYSSIGMVNGIPDLIKTVVESGAYNEKYRILPFLATDGVNEKGLYAQINIVPWLDFDINSDSTTECCALMAIRYILDHCADFDDVENFFNTAHIYPAANSNFGYHYFIAKDNDWRIIELTADGHRTVTPDDIPYAVMTNFRMTDLTFSGSQLNWNSVETYGLGVERYEIGATAFTQDIALKDLRDELFYTNLYTDTAHSWKTEFCGDTSIISGSRLTVMDALEHPSYFEPLFAVAEAAYENRDRTDGGQTWQTTHSAIYDLEKKSINIVIQERLDKEYDFSLTNEVNLEAYAKKSWVEEQGYLTQEDKLVEGDNVTISGNVISAVDTINHDSFTNRNLPNQHTIGAITGLETALTELKDAKNIFVKQDITVGTTVGGLTQGMSLKDMSLWDVIYTLVNATAPVSAYKEIYTGSIATGSNPTALTIAGLVSSSAGGAARQMRTYDDYGNVKILVETGYKQALIITKTELEDIQFMTMSDMDNWDHSTQIFSDGGETQLFHVYKSSVAIGDFSYEIIPKDQPGPGPVLVDYAKVYCGSIPDNLVPTNLTIDGIISYTGGTSELRYYEELGQIKLTAPVPQQAIILSQQQLEDIRFMNMSEIDDWNHTTYTFSDSGKTKLFHAYTIHVAAGTFNYTIM